VKRVVVVVIEGADDVYAHAYDATTPMSTVAADATAYFGAAAPDGAQLLGPATGGDLPPVQPAHQLWQSIGGETLAQFLLGSPP
jgi:hypothetical protein